MADENIKPASPTYIHGIGSSQVIDTAGEIVDLAGIDCSSLVGGAFNWEHKSDVPAQIVGKILEYKKIFSEADCENENHQYFWDKCQTPYLYVMGRLFDDKKPSAEECAALFLDDAEHPDEPPMVGLSIEGSKVDKKGIIVTKSIARKITCTNVPANKQCVAEIVKNPDSKPASDEDSIFKSEPVHTIELLEKHEPLSKREIPSSKIPSAEPAASPSKAIKGAPGWKHTGGGNFQHPEHGVVSVVKQGSEYHVKHGGTLAGVGGKKGVFGSAKEAGAHAGNYIRGLGEGKTVSPKMHDRPSPNMAKGINVRIGMGGMNLPQESTDTKNKRGLFNPDMDRITGGRGMIGGGMGMGGGGKSEKKGNLKKAMTAGSGMASPGSLSGGAALAKESLDKKMKKSVSIKTGVHQPTQRSGENQKGGQSRMGTQVRAGNLGSAKATARATIEGARKIKPKLDKSEWLLRAEQAYKTWGKREMFESFMAKNMPNLTKGEIQALGQTLALRKSLRAEAKLKKMMRDEGQDSWVKKNENMQKALKFGSLEDQTKLAAANEERKKNPPKKFEPKKKAPELKGPVESEVTHVEPWSNTHDTVHLKSGHVLSGSKKGTFKIGDKVSARPHIMNTHILEHKK